MTIERIKETLEQAKLMLNFYKNIIQDNEFTERCETVIWALEKQVPKNPKGKKAKLKIAYDFASGEVYDYDMTHYYCPSCDELVGDSLLCRSDRNRKPYCSICGQSLDWRK